MKSKKNRNDSIEILIAEDSATQRERLKYLLQEHGYSVVAATNGNKALKAAHRRKPTLIITDIVMPELDGYGLCKALKSDETLKDVPVILLTTLSDARDVVFGLECGADNFIRKPYEGEYLLQRIDYLLMNLKLRKNQKMRMGIEISLGGERHFITAERQQILDLLISTYEQATYINQELEAANKEIEAQCQRVQEANRLKSEFLANMSHELRTPLNAIIGFSELIHDGKAGRVSAEQKEYLGDILTSGRHLLQLINDVLDLAKVEAGKMEFHPEPVELDKIIGEVHDVLRTLMSHKRINVDIEVDTGLIGIAADPAKLKQILYNYLSNAIKFTSEGGRVVIRALPQGEKQYRIEVEDSGTGIREEDMPRLFAEFQQIDSGMAKKYQGTGLGLALTKRMVEAQGGEVGARSTFGKGSVFYAVLPQQMAATLETEPVSTWHAPANAPLLLVVVDDRDDLAWMTRVLEEEGYRTEAATDGAQAVARCRKKVYDAIVLDLLLPDISGWQVLKMSQEDGLNRTTPVIVVSVLSDAAKGRALVQAFMTKPVSREALVQELAQAGVHGWTGNRILVVDDDPKALKLAENMLTELGYSVLTATDGEQGLALLKQLGPDAVVLDLLMPGMSGFEFLEQLYDLEGGLKVPVIVWTVKDLTPEEHRQLHAQAHAVVAKGDPKGISSLLEPLRKLVPPNRVGVEKHLIGIAKIE